MPRVASRSESKQTLVVLTAAVVTFLVGIALYWGRAIFIPLAMAIFFTFVLTPLVVWLQRRGLGRVLSVILVVGFSLIVCATVATIVGQQMVQLTQTLPDHADRIKAKLAVVKGWMSDNEQGRFAGMIAEIQEIFAGPAPRNVPGDPNSPQTVVVESSPSWLVRAQSFLSPAAEALGQAAFTLILVIFMLLKREDLRNRVIRLLGQGQVTTTTKAVDETSRRISRYLLAQFLLNTAFGLLIMVVLLIMRVPYAPLWGFTAFLMRYVPYIGTWIGVIPPALFTFAVSDGWGLTVGVLVLFLGLELVCNNLIEPLLYGKRLGLSEVAQLVATAFWAFLWGPVGMILAWPLTTCLLVMGKYVPQLRILNVLLGDEPVLSPRVAYYQRLAAHDQDEAADIVEKELATRPAEQVFDDLLIPSLMEARKDAAEGLLSESDMIFVATATKEIAEEVPELKDGTTAPAEDRVRVLFAPGKDSLDGTAAELLVRLLDSALWEAQVAPANTLTSELSELIEKVQPKIFVIVSLPPGGLTHTRYLCKRLRQRHPDLKLLVARLSDAEHEPGEAIPLLTRAGANEVTVSLEATRTFLQGWRAVLAIDSVEEAEAKVEKKLDRAKGVGMVPA